MKTMTFDEWWDTYKPIDNPFQSSPTHPVKMFETYGDELTYVMNCNEAFVWTQYDDDTICNNFGIVNRLGYYVTELPCAEKFILIDNLEMGFDIDGVCDSCLENTGLKEVPISTTDSLYHCRECIEA